MKLQIHVKQYATAHFKHVLQFVENLTKIWCNFESIENYSEIFKFIYLFIYLFIHSFIHSFIHLFIYLFFV